MSKNINNEKNKKNIIISTIKKSNIEELKVTFKRNFGTHKRLRYLQLYKSKTMLGDFSELSHKIKCSSSRILYIYISYILKNKSVSILKVFQIQSSATQCYGAEKVFFLLSLYYICITIYKCIIKTCSTMDKCKF